MAPDQSVLAQRKEPDLYPEITAVGRYLGAMHIFREWSFGRYASIRQPQPADLPEDLLLPDSRNLALVLNQIEHKDGRQFNQLLKRFSPVMSECQPEYPVVLCSSIYMNPDSLHLSRQRAYPTEQSGSSQSSLPSYHPRRRPWCASKNRNSGFILTRLP